MKTRKFTLEEKDIPEKWYNILADMPNKPLPPAPPRNTETDWSRSTGPAIPDGIDQTGSLNGKMDRNS